MTLVFYLLLVNVLIAIFKECVLLALLPIESFVGASLTRIGGLEYDQIRSIEVVFEK
jgi:hypothetical protein